MCCALIFQPQGHARSTECGDGLSVQQKWTCSPQNPQSTALFGWKEVLSPLGEDALTQTWPFLCIAMFSTDSIHGPAGKPENPVGCPQLALRGTSPTGRTFCLSLLKHHLYVWFLWRQIYTIVRLQSSSDVDWAASSGARNRWKIFQERWRTHRGLTTPQTDLTRSCPGTQFTSAEPFIGCRHTG